MRYSLAIIASFLLLPGCQAGAVIGPSVAATPVASASAVPTASASATATASASAAASASPSPAASGATLGCASAPQTGWVGIWATSPAEYYQFVSVYGPSDPFMGSNQVNNQTLRFIAHPSMAATTIRIHFSNVFGNQSVTFDSVHVGKAVSSTSGAVVASTDAPVTFGCATSVSVPMGQQVTSDPIALPVAHADSVAVTFFMKGPSGHITYHPQAAQTNYLTAPGAGDSTGDTAGVSFTQSVASSFFLTGIDAYAPANPGTIVAFGDSITDGTASVVGGNGRWPDALADILDATGSPSAVINEGISGNTVLRSAASLPPGQNMSGDPGVERFDRDVLAQTHVRAVIILLGTNDLGALGGLANATSVYDGLVSLAQRTHMAGIKRIFVATLTPRTETGYLGGGALFPPTQQAQLTALNAMIRASTSFDGFVEFHDAMADPANSANLNPIYDSGDGLHPNDAGHKVMAQAVPLGPLK